MTGRDDGGQDRAGELDLQRFFPYRLANLADAVSRSIAQLYADRFDLTRQEWRVLATLGGRRFLSGRELATATALDKMQVSRALARLEARGLVIRGESLVDRRNQQLSLTSSGRALLRKITPLVRAREEYILAALSIDERAQLDAAMDKVLYRAEGLIRTG